MKKILVTGGAGYIGSHTVIKLIEDGYDPIILDDLSNSNAVVIDRIAKITSHRPKLIIGDIRDSALLDKIFEEHDIWAVIHFAGKKSVNESQRDPISYYSVNVAGSLSLFQSMMKHNVKNLIFSSSATVYDMTKKEKLKETDSVGPINNYGRSKLIVENMLQDIYASDPSWKIVILRYFNPVGAHPSGLIGEDPKGVPANIMPFISKVAIGELPLLNIFGNDYKTRDGTGARDFIHVEDLARGHIASLRLFEQMPKVTILNLGTGNNMTVMELVKAFEEINKVPIPFKIVGRRPGDSGACYADPSKALEEIGWRSEKNIFDICKDTWNWQQKNPHGYC